MVKHDPAEPVPDSADRQGQAAEIARLRDRIATLQANGASAAEARSRDHDRAQMYLDIVGSMIVILDRDGRVTLMNRTGCEQLGYAEDEVIGRDWFDLCIPEEQRAEVRRVFRQLMDGAVEPVASFENRVLSRHRGERIVKWRNTILRDADGAISGTLSAGDDVTRQRALEQAMRQSERIETAGMLAETVSQNFGNVLNAIGSYASTLCDALIPDTRPHMYARRIIDATRHAEVIIRRLMNIARASSGAASFDVQQVSLAEIVTQAVTLLGHVFSARQVKIQIQRPERWPYVMADAEQLIDVLMSILTNSVEAMSSGGVIRIACQARAIQRPRGNPDVQGGTFAVLRIHDTGAGMSRTVLRRVFEPFFSTKAGSTTMGLGLHVARNMVMGMGGWLAATSRENRGTAFRIYLRKAEPPAAVDIPILCTGQSVLVAEDDRRDADIIREHLQRVGHHVIEAATAQEAMAHLAQHGENLSCAIVDFAIRDGEGRWLMEHLVRREPPLPVVVTSGFSRDFVRARVAFGTWTFLQKPFTGNLLIESLNRTIGREGAET